MMGRAGRARTIGGGVLLLGILVGLREPDGSGEIGRLAAAFAIAWMVSVLLTHKYVNKYPQRYLTYLAASHIKAAISMAAVLAPLILLMDSAPPPWSVVWSAFVLFVVADAAISAVWRQSPLSAAPSHEDCSHESEIPEEARTRDVIAPTVSLEGLVVAWDQALDQGLAAFITEHVPAEARQARSVAEVLIVGTPLNDIRRLSKTLLACAAKIRPEGYFVGTYVPLENVQASMRRRYSGMSYYSALALHSVLHRAVPKIPYLNSLYFAMTHGKGRVLSTTEMWGRLQRWGLEVVAESEGDRQRFLIARKTGEPSPSTKASYYPMIALDRIGVNGQIIRAHKIRTMYPFSEFLQKRVFESNSFATTGKFAGDFRVTGYGRILRKYWLDELPQLYDWWRGDIKLVGLRAMSRHYFSLYPKSFQELYVKVKPGLIPPIFGESTGGFSEIVEVERRYLENYLRAPAWTDLRYLLITMNDILIKGVRSH